MNKNMKKIGIVGSRRRNSKEDYKLICGVFLELYEDGDWIISGGCSKGGDLFAEIIAKKAKVPIMIFYPDWNKYGRAGGFQRNTYIANESDILIACVAEDRKGGTEDTIRKFLKQKSESNLYIV